MVELNLQIRAGFRGLLPSSGERPEETNTEASKLANIASQSKIPVNLESQPPLNSSAETSQTLAPPSPTAPVEQDHEPVLVPGASKDEPADEDMEPEAAPLIFSQLQSDFFKQGLGKDNAMLFKDATFQDRLLVHKVLLGGQSKLKLARVVDLYNHVDVNDSGKRRRIRPSQGQARNGSRKVVHKLPKPLLTSHVQNLATLSCCCLSK